MIRPSLAWYARLSLPAPNAICAKSIQRNGNAFVSSRKQRVSPPSVACGKALESEVCHFRPAASQKSGRASHAQAKDPQGNQEAISLDRQGESEVSPSRDEPSGDRNVEEAS